MATTRTRGRLGSAVAPASLLSSLGGAGPFDVLLLRDVPYRIGSWGGGGSTRHHGCILAAVEVVAVASSPPVGRGAGGLGFDGVDQEMVGAALHRKFNARSDGKCDVMSAEGAFRLELHPTLEDYLVLSLAAKRKGRRGWRSRLPETRRPAFEAEGTSAANPAGVRAGPEDGVSMKITHDENGCEVREVPVTIVSSGWGGVSCDDDDDDDDDEDDEDDTDTGEYSVRFFETATFYAELIDDVPSAPRGVMNARLALSLTFIHCDDPSLDDTIRRLCASGIFNISNEESSSIVSSGSGDKKGLSSPRVEDDNGDGNDHHDDDDAQMDALEIIECELEGRVVVEGGMLALPVPLCRKMGLRDGEDAMLFRMDSIAIEGDVDAAGGDRDDVRGPRCLFARGIAADGGKPLMLRLGSKDAFSVVSIRCVDGCDASPAETYTCTSASKRGGSFDCRDSRRRRRPRAPPPTTTTTTRSCAEDPQPGCPGYEPLVQELLAIAGIGNRNAAPSAVLLTGCTGVGKSRVASHVVDLLSNADGEDMSYVTKIVSAKDVLLSAVSSNLEDLKAFILREPWIDDAMGTTPYSAKIANIQRKRRALLVIDDLDIFVDSDSTAGNSNAWHDGERFLSLNAIIGALDGLIQLGSFGSRRARIMSTPKMPHPFIIGICSAGSARLPPELTCVGRFEKVVVMHAPTQSQRELILKVLFSGLCTQRSEHEDRSHSMTDGWAAACAPVTSGCVAADLERLCMDAVTRAISRSLANASRRTRTRTRTDALDCQFDESAIANGRNIVVTWEDIREAAMSCVPSQLAQLDVSMGGKTLIQNVASCASGNRLDNRKLHDLSWEKFGGYDDVKARLYRTVVGPWKRRLIDSREVYLTAQGVPSLQVDPPSGVLFHGGPGVGKTLAAQCLASSLGFPVVKVRASDVLDQWLGGSEAAIRSLFERARAASPCVLFFDEIDALATNREDDDGSTNVHSRVLSTLLNEIDGVSNDAGRKDILVIAATNRLCDIDAALLRPGRLDEHIFLKNPTSRDIAAILNVHLNNVPLGSDVTLEQLSESLEKAGASGADVEGICNDACLHAIHQLKKTDDPRSIRISLENFDTAMRQWKM